MSSSNTSSMTSQTTPQTYIIAINNRDTFQVTAISKEDAVEHFKRFYLSNNPKLLQTAVITARLQS